MLEKTRKKTATAGKDNVNFLVGELHDHKGDCELLVLNMVLHHLASPINFFFEAKQHITAGGCLLIADLCAHDQNWTTDTCGDLWLGFDADELDGWASAAGFETRTEPLPGPEERLPGPGQDLSLALIDF